MNSISSHTLTFLIISPTLSLGFEASNRFTLFATLLQVLKLTTLQYDQQVGWNGHAVYNISFEEVFQLP